MLITSIAARPLALAFREPYHWAGRVDYGAVNLLVEVQTDNGLTGYGECIAARPAEVALSAILGVAPLFIGQSPYDNARLMHQARFLGSFNYTPRFANLTLAGVEMALWDLLGKAAGLPVYQLMGGAFHDQVDYFGFVQGDTAQELRDSAARLAAQDYSVIYLKVGRGEAVDIENSAAVRSAIGSRKLRLDANEAWDPRTAIYMIRKLEQFDPEFIEQPTPAGSIPALRQVKDLWGVPVAADQCAFTLYEVYEICRQRAADAIVLSLHETGGLLAFRQAAAVAQAAAIPICLHGQSVTGLTDLAQHHAALTTPNLTDGNQIMHQLLEQDIIASPDLTPQAGKLGLPPARPGFGFELDWDAVELAAERYQRNEAYHHS